MKLAAIILVGALIGVCRADEPTTRPDTISLDVHRNWEPILIYGRNLQIPPSVDLKLEDDGAKFIAAGENVRAVWDYRILVPIDAVKFPILKITYRAEGIDTKREDYGIRLYLRERGASINCSELVADGSEQVLTKDLRDVSFTDSIAGVRIGVVPATIQDAYIKVKSIEFQPAPDSEHRESKDDPPMKVQVMDPDGKPMGGAKVIVDAERKSASRTADTDGEGMATLTPLSNEAELHMFEIQAEGMATMLIAPPTVATEQAIEVKMQRAAKYGGVVHDADGKAIEGATVRINITAPRGNPADGIVLRRAIMRTDAEGKFQSPPLPEDNPPTFRLGHPDFVSDNRFAPATSSIEDLKSGAAEFVMKK